VAASEDSARVWLLAQGLDLVPQAPDLALELCLVLLALPRVRLELADLRSGRLPPLPGARDLAVEAVHSLLEQVEAGFFLEEGALVPGGLLGQACEGPLPGLDLFLDGPGPRLAVREALAEGLAVAGETVSLSAQQLELPLEDDPVGLDPLGLGRG
jgi:hypothetical protein